MRILVAILLCAGAAFAESADRAEYAKRWKSVSWDMAREHRLAARFCEERKLWAAARSEWLAAAAYAPENEDVQKALGKVKKDGAWVEDPGAKVKTRNEGTPKQRDEALEIYRKKRANLVALAQRILAPLAEWADDRGLEESEGLWLLFHGYDPADAGGCRAAGWEKLDGDWMPKTEAAGRKHAQEVLRTADGGEEQEGATEATKAAGWKLARRGTGNFTFEGRYPQGDLEGFLQVAEAARALFIEIASLEPQQHPAPMTGVFLTGKADHARFIEKCTPLEEDERETYKLLGGWTRFNPTVFELWTNGALSSYGREASAHVTAHLMFQSWTGIAEPPAWLQEGLAFWFSDRLTESALVRCTDLKSNIYGDDRSLSTRGWRRRILDALREGTDPDIRQVVHAKYDELDMEKMIKAWSLIDFMLERHREGFVKFVRALGAGEPVDTALFDALGIEGWAGLQGKWEAWVRESY
ncbi:MAG: hypothetical protein HYY18_23675 [Planctomycetes bacterium]|nr:hypothetical protein [Planctomycetota bacterium]